MKKKIAIMLTTVMLGMTLFGCDDPSKTTANPGNEQSQEQETAEAAPAEDATDADMAVTDGGAGQDSAEAASTEEVASNTATEAVSYDPEEIVEPEIPAEEVTQPAEVPQEEPEEPEQEPEKKKKKDKKFDIVFMGDSQFDNARGTASDIPSYTCCLLDKDVKFYNLAIGGTSASLGREDYVDDVSQFNDSCFVGICYALAGKCSPDFLSQYAAYEDYQKVTPENVDLYVIEYGANDYINGKDLFNSGSNNDIHTYNGALTEGIETLQKISPKAKFIICSPAYCVWYNGSGEFIGDSNVVSKGIGPLSEYANTASNLANAFGFPYLDAMYASMFDLKQETYEDYLSDGLHFTEKGRQIYASVLAHLIQQVRGKDEGDIPYFEINCFDFWAYKESIGR